MAIDNHHRSEYSRTNTNRNIPISPMDAAVGSRFATTCFLCAYLPNYSDRLSCLEFDENAPSWRRLLNSGLRRSSRCDVDTFKDSILDANLRRRRDQSAMGMHSLFISPSRLEFDEAVHSWRRLLNSGLRCSPRDIDTCMDSIPNVLKRRHRDQAVLDVMTDHVSNGERKVRRPLLRANPLRGGGCTSTLYLPSPHGPLAHDRLGVYVLCANNLAVPGVVDHGGTGTLQLPSSHGPLAHDRLGVFVLCADDPAVLGVVDYEAPLLRSGEGGSIPIADLEDQPASSPLDGRRLLKPFRLAHTTHLNVRWAGRGSLEDQLAPPLDWHRVRAERLSPPYLSSSHGPQAHDRLGMCVVFVDDVVMLSAPHATRSAFRPDHVEPAPCSVRGG